MRLLTLLALILLPVACARTYGTRVATLAVARAPAGTNAYYNLVGDPGGARYCELIAVEEGALLIRTDRVVRIPWSRLAYLNVDKFGARFDLAPGEHPHAEKIERLKLLSRFPQGLSGPLLAQFLAAIKQDAVDELP